MIPAVKIQIAIPDVCLLRATSHDTFSNVFITHTCTLKGGSPYLFKHIKVRDLSHWLNTDHHCSRAFQTQVPTLQLQELLARTNNFSVWMHTRDRNLFVLSHSHTLQLKFKIALRDICVCVNMWTVCVQLGVTCEAGRIQNPAWTDHLYCLFM